MSDAVIAARSSLPWADFSPVQRQVLGLALAINVLDGFDILAMAYAAPVLAVQWALDPGSLGMLLSAGLAGMVVGSLTLGPLADRIGRRPAVMLCLVLAAAGMVAASLSTTFTALVASRVATGIAIGGMLPCLNTITAEYAPRHARPFAVALMQAGFPIGATVGGFLSVWLLARFGWQSVFLLGGAVTICLLPLVWWRMPESRSYLDAVASRANPSLPGGARNAPERTALWRNCRLPLLLVVAIFFCCTMGFYFLSSWTPQILAASGMPVGWAVSGGALLTAGSIVSAIAIGWSSIYRPLAPLVIATALGSAIATALFGLLPPSLGIVLVGAVLLGLLVGATQAGIYALVPSLFPPEVRASATGLAVGIGRLGSVIGPWLAGLLLTAGAGKAGLFAAMALPYAAAALLIVRARSFQIH